MCGISGYVGTDECVSVVERSLRNLEYRGYDSAGVALHDGDVSVHKEAGRIDELSLPDARPECHTVIGHTRWSTHGPPTDENAHPHTDCTGEIAVVHNGIIENYDDLRGELGGRHSFTSDTDTEVVPHLLEEELEGGTGLVDAFSAVVERLEGSFALAATVKGYDGIVAARFDSPLVIGHDETGHFLASDVPAFLEDTRTVTYLEDGDVAHVTEETVTIYNDGTPVDREPRTVDWDPKAAEKGGYDHYMRKEIDEQPSSLRQALTGRVDGDAGTVDLDLDLPTGYLDSLEEVQFVAAGTSYHAGLYAAELVEEAADVRASVHVASEYDFSGGRDPWRTLVIAVSQSGETADTLSAIQEAEQQGARTLAVTNTVGSTITRRVDQSLYIRAGPEIGVAATKTYGSQVATLAMLAVYLGRERGTLAPQAAEEMLADIRSFPAAVQQVLDQEAEVRAAARTYADRDAFFFIGRGLGHSVALEGALKLKEISYDHAEGFAAGELKHGPLALVTPETLVLAVQTVGAQPEETRSNVKEVQARGAATLGVTSTGVDGDVFDTALEVPDAGSLTPAVANVYLQLFAYHVAKRKGRPIDKPRNLAKSVTVE
jgi:glucosamine--fructose-6-phosphate aminotransferase (isomerizing)